MYHLLFLLCVTDCVWVTDSRYPDAFPTYASCINAGYLATRAFEYNGYDCKEVKR